MTDSLLHTTAGRLASAHALLATRRRVVPDTPALLGCRLIHDYRMTPTCALIGDAVAWGVRTPDARLVICCPPRESKSTTVSVASMIWALARDPETAVILAAYADSLSLEHSATARGIVSEHGGPLGLPVADDKSAAGRWRIDGHKGAVLATGILSGVTGFGADLLLATTP